MNALCHEERIPFASVDERWDGRPEGSVRKYPLWNVERTEETV